MLDKIKDHAVFWSSGAEASGAGASRAKWRCHWLTTVVLVEPRFCLKAPSSLPIWDGQVLEEEWLVMMKGAPNEDEAAMDFLIHASSTGFTGRAGQVHQLWTDAFFSLRYHRGG